MYVFSQMLIASSPQNNKYILYYVRITYPTPIQTTALSYFYMLNSMLLLYNKKKSQHKLGILAGQCKYPKKEAKPHNYWEEKSSIQHLRTKELVQRWMH